MPRFEPRKLLPGGLTGLAGAACAACCVIPLLLAAGIVGGAGWTAAGRIMPGIAIVLIAMAVGTWWWATRRRRHASGCDGSSCGCSRPTHGAQETVAARPLR